MSGLFGFVKSFLGYNGELVKPISGSLFSLNKCLYNSSQLEIRKGAGQFEYELIVKRVVYEGEEYDESIRNQFIFPISDRMNLSNEPSLTSDFAFSWIDVTPGTGGQRYVFEFSDSDEENQNRDVAREFQVAICKCMYENRYQTSAAEVSEEDLNQFVSGSSNPSTPAKGKTTNPSTPSSAYSTPKKDFSTPKKAESTPSSKKEEQFVTPKKEEEKKSGKTPIRADPNIVLATEYPSQSEIKVPETQGSQVLSLEAQLYQFNANSNVFEPREEVVVQIKSTGDNKTTFSFVLSLFKKTGKDLILSQQVNSEMNMTYFEKEHSVIWLYKIGSHVWTWSLLFHNQQDEEVFKRLFHEKLWETNSQKPFSKLKEDEQDWVHQSYREDVEMEDDDGLQEQDMMDFEEEEEFVEDDSENEEEEEGIAGKNSLLTVGTKNQRSFVARGSKIGVFAHTPDNRVEFKTTINRLKNGKGEYFTPKKMVLHEGESSMLMLNSDQKDTVMKLDLNRPDVVDEWKLGDTYPVNDLFHQTKLSQADNDALVMGLNRMGFMTIDPRTKEKVVPNHSYSYKASTKPELSCVATTQNGQMAVGSSKGEIRLFSSKTLSTPKKDFDAAPRANTSLPGFGDPIIGIDVSKDGNWILATCKTYLLVVPAEFADGKNGFDNKMGKDKPAPRRLQLKNEHIAMMGGTVNFTTAKFNVTEGKEEETAIVTSTGPFVIAWNFRKVKQNQLNIYQIKQYDEVVVGDQFRFGDDKNIVVATPQNVQMAKRAVQTFESVSSPFRQSSPFKSSPIRRG